MFQLGDTNEQKVKKIISDTKKKAECSDIEQKVTCAYVFFLWGSGISPPIVWLTLGQGDRVDAI